MKYRKLLKKLIEYEKNLSGFSFSMPARIISLFVAFGTHYGIDKHNIQLSKENMEYLIDTYLEEDILVLPLYDEELESGLIATGEVLIAYLKEYNINATIVGSKVMIISEKKKLDEFIYDNIELEEIRKILTYEEVERNYNLETSTNYWFKEKDSEGRIVLEFKK